MKCWTIIEIFPNLGFRRCWAKLAAHLVLENIHRSKGPGDVFDPGIRSLGALGEGSGWDLKIRPAPPAAWKSGDLEICFFGNLETWKSRFFGIQQNKNIKVLKIQIRFAQNVGKVWISRKKNLPGPISGHPRRFSPWTDKNPKIA